MGRKRGVRQRERQAQTYTDRGEGKGDRLVERSVEGWITEWKGQG